jgi:hypothetical protein
MRTIARASRGDASPEQQLGNEKMKKKSKTFTAQEKDTQNPRLAETVARYKARREAVGKDLFQDYELALVALIAALVSGDNTKPEDAVEHAFKILDASRRRLSDRAQKRDTIIHAPVPTHALQYTFRDGVRAITRQERPSRGEEYFGKFLRSTLGTKPGAKELERLKRERFTVDEVSEFETQYEEFQPRQRKKF